MIIQIKHNLPKKFEVLGNYVGAGDTITLTEDEYNKIDIFWKAYINIVKKDEPKKVLVRHEKMAKPKRKVEDVKPIIKDTVMVPDKVAEEALVEDENKVTFEDFKLPATKYQPQVKYNK